MEKSADKMSILRRLFWSVVGGGRPSEQDIVLKTGKEEDLDLTLLFLRKGSTLPPILRP